MDLDTFHKDFIEAVRSKAESSRDFIRTAFVEDCGNRLIEAEELLSFEVCRFEGVNGKRKSFASTATHLMKQTIRWRY